MLTKTQLSLQAKLHNLFMILVAGISLALQKNHVMQVYLTFEVALCCALQHFVPWFACVSASVF